MRFRCRPLLRLSTFLAAGLCGLPAQGQDTAAHFRIVTYQRPDAIADLGVGLWAQPLPMDYDHDGKLDLLVSCSGVPYNGLYFFRNLGGDDEPLFDRPQRLGPGMANLQVSYRDGVPRLTLPGARIHNLVSGTGPALFPADSLAHRFKKIRANQWKLEDMDGDGDDDILVGLGVWDDYGWDNAFDSLGRWTRGPLHGYVYLLENAHGRYNSGGRLRTTDGALIDQFGAPSPNVGDFDGDGDKDLICGEFLDGMTWFENTGSADQPAYAPGRILSNAAGPIRMPLEMINPVAVDWNRDGRLDLVVGQEDGRVAWLRNTGQVKDHMPVFATPVFFRQRAGDLKFGVLSTPVGVDWDGDGDQDIVAGNSAGNIALIRNLGGLPPRWAPPELLWAEGKPIRIMAGKNGSIQGPAEAKWGYTVLSVADWDGDGRPDLIVNSIWGRVVWYRNTGRQGARAFGGARPVQVAWVDGPPKPVWNWWQPRAGELVTQWRSTPYALDWNRDGVMDLVMLDPEGYLALFEGFRQGGRHLLRPGRRLFYGETFAGFNTNHAVTDSLPGPLRLNTGRAGSSGRRKFCLADWDGDGRLDLLVNSRNVTWMRNTGQRGDTVFFAPGVPLSDDRLAGHTTSPTIVDWDGDGRPELLVGAEDGHFYHLPSGGDH